MQALLKRKDGEEQPYVPLGIFKFRCPFIHTGWQWTEAIQGFCMVATPISAATLVMQILELPFELAIMFVLTNNILYLLHPMFGDPVFPGWITPGMALVTAFLMQYPAGTERIHMLVALQLTIAAIFLIMGVSGLASRVMAILPASMRGGILLGAGISSMTTCLTKQFVGHEISLGVGMLVSFAFMYSLNMAKKKANNAFLRQIGKYGLMAGLVVAYILAIVFGEIAPPSDIFKDGMFTTYKGYSQVLNSVTVFAVGFPPAACFIASIPMAITDYIIAFGDFVYAQVLTGQSIAARGDEYIDFNANRSNIISAIRNIIMALFFPYPPMLGPLWGAGVTSVAERYKHGRWAMDSIYDGLIPYIAFMCIGIFLRPVVNIFQPVLFLGMGLTLAVQGFASLYIAMELLPTKEERACGGLTGIMLAIKGSTWGLGTAIVLHLVVGVSEERKEEERAKAAAERELLEMHSHKAKA